MSAGAKWERRGTRFDNFKGRAPQDRKGKSVQCWCYLCGSEHRFAEPCLQRVAPRRDTVVCAVCKEAFVPGKRTTYCSDPCRHEAKLARRRVPREAVA